MITMLDLVRNCAKIGQIIISPTKISIDQRIPNNPLHSSNGGDYFEWMIIVWDINSTIHFVEKSSCELPISLNNWYEVIEGVESFDDLCELVINLATNYDCQIIDTRL